MQDATEPLTGGDRSGPVVLLFDQVNAYETRLLDGIRSALASAGVSAVVYAHDPFTRRLRSPVVQLLKSSITRGVICTMLADEESQADLEATRSLSGLPWVQVGGPSSAARCPTVGVDNVASMRTLMEHLLDTVGARRVALMRGLDHHVDAIERETVVRGELSARGLVLEPSFVMDGRFDRDVAYNAMARLLRGGGVVPDAVVALNDRSAVGVLDALIDAGLRVPGDVWVTGFDDDVIARECTPGLTTVSQDLFGQGVASVGLLLEQLAGNQPRGHTALGGTLVVRGSTGQRAGLADDQLPPQSPVNQSLAIAAMDRALAINRAFMACVDVAAVLDKLRANMSRLGLKRCFIVLYQPSKDSGAPPSARLMLRYVEEAPSAMPDDQEIPAGELLPVDLAGELCGGCLVLQPLAAEGSELGYVLFEQSIPDRFVGELFRMDLVRSIDGLQRTDHHARTLEALVAQRTKQLRAEVATRSKAEHELRLANKELLRLSRVDGLTGIANRTAFDEYMDVEWLRHCQARSPLSLLLIDVDQFKQHNDTFGHLSGDECLRNLARCLGESLWSPEDLAARYGGDEFVAVLPHTDAAGAAAVAERLQLAVRDRTGSGRGRQNAFTISVGAATVVPALTQTPADIVAIADTGLYRAKLDGRDRSVAGTL